MDMDESVGRVGVSVGDLVLPRDREEFLFVCPAGMDPDFDPIEVVWDGVAGLVVDVLPSRSVDLNYRRVCIMVGGQIGWTYSDYVCVVGGD